MNIRLAATVAGLAFTLACGETSRPSRNELPIINGTPDTSQAHMAVVYLLVLSSSGAWACSGTLIGPSAVLSAGHCVVGNGGVIQPQDATVYFGNTVGSMTSRAVSAVYAHPGYQSVVPVPNDISMLLLEEPAPAWATPIPPLPAALGLTQADVGGAIEYSGFGLDENGHSGRKLHVFGEIAVVCGRQGACAAGMVPSSFCSQMEVGGTCSGDSGGPAFIVRDSVEYVAGITSYGDWRCSHFGCSTSVDGHQAFIDEVVGTEKPVGDRCATSSQCQSGYCVDGYCCQSECQETCYACDLPKSEGTCLPAPDGHACTDGDPCNGSELCQTGACVNQANPPVCNSSSPCLVASCRQGTGCVYEPVTDGNYCQDNDLCNGPDACLAGLCVPTGPAPECDDDNPCTEDSCEPASGCLNQALADGTSCADADRCNGDESCHGGQCQGTDPPDCDDMNPCTDDSCQSASGCHHDALPEGSRCGADRTCQQNLCLPSKGGGCSTSSGGESWPAAVLGLFWLFRRRRRAV